MEIDLILFTEEEKAKLPKWATNKIHSLENHLSDLNTDIKRLSDSHPMSKVYVNKYGQGPNIYLYDHDAITFKVGDNEREVVTAHMNMHYPGYLRVDSENVEGLQIKPIAANCILVR
jgi:hypothetical protein